MQHLSHRRTKNFYWRLSSLQESFAKCRDDRIPLHRYKSAHIEPLQQSGFAHLRQTRTLYRRRSGCHQVHDATCDMKSFRAPNRTGSALSLNTMNSETSIDRAEQFFGLPLPNFPLARFDEIAFKSIDIAVYKFGIPVRHQCHTVTNKTTIVGL